MMLRFKFRYNPKATAVKISIQLLECHSVIDHYRKEVAGKDLRKKYTEYTKNMNERYISRASSSGSLFYVFMKFYYSWLVNEVFWGLENWIYCGRVFPTEAEPWV